MSERPKWKGLAALALATLIIWKPTIVVLIPGLLYTSDLDTVFLHEGCVNGSSQTVFVFCLLEVLLACLLLTAQVLPMFFGARWDGFDHLKQRKLVGFLVKIILRLSCASQILILVASHFAFRGGLFSKFNIKDAYVRFHEGITQTCAAAGMAVSDASALRAWTFVRDDMMAVMIWELSFIPELPSDAWLHHLFVILGVALGSDPHFMAQNAKIQPLIDGVAFFMVLGAAFAAFVEAPVLMYHFTAGSPERQARWMIRSLCVQSVVVLVFFVAMPCTMIAMNASDLGLVAIMMIILIAFLTAVEVRMMVVKWAIVKSSRRKALRQREQPPEVAAEASDAADNGWLQPGASFSHNLIADLAAQEAEGTENEMRHSFVRDGANVELGEPSCTPVPAQP